MSRIGKQPVKLPSGVKVNLAGRQITIEGAKGKLTWEHHSQVSVTLDEQNQNLQVSRADDDRLSRALHGLTRSLLANMVQGVVSGFEKRLEIVGVGYTASLQDKDLNLQLGWSHPVVIKCPERIEFEVPDPTHIVIRGPDKQQVGQLAAEIRGLRPPEPYKGKGIRYHGEVVRRKAGKSYAGGGG